MNWPDMLMLHSRRMIMFNKGKMKVQLGRRHNKKKLQTETVKSYTVKNGIKYETEITYKISPKTKRKQAITLTEKNLSTGAVRKHIFREIRVPEPDHLPQMPPSPRPPKRTQIKNSIAKSKREIK